MTVGQYASQIAGLREFLHEELVRLGLTTPEQITTVAADEAAAAEAAAAKHAEQEGQA